MEKILLFFNALMSEVPIWSESLKMGVSHWDKDAVAC